MGGQSHFIRDHCNPMKQLFRGRVKLSQGQQENIAESESGSYKSVINLQTIETETNSIQYFIIYVSLE